ncbi:glycosyltransferase family 4 protein [Micrococcus luteus]|uniref:glycosyltransferase family 4 protein n=1 Tax=Micrococcus luteus TaxID=1270 RepID=UPI0038792CEA
MRIVIVSQFFHPEPAITVNELCRRLVADGHDVHVVTGYPNRPGGRLYDGYRQRLRHTETWEGAVVHRVPLLINHDRHAARRIGNFVSFALASLLKTRIGGSADAVYVYATPMTAAVAPLVWRKLFDTPYVLHVQDLWPESVTESGMLGRGVVVRATDLILRQFVGLLYREASHVVAIAPRMAGTLAARGVPADRLHTSLNWADERSVSPVDRVPEEGGPVRFVYAGNIGVFQDVGTILEAAAMLQDLPGVHIDVFGDGTELPGLLERSRALTNITFHGRVPRTEMAEVYRRSDFQLITLRDLPLFRGTIPSKFQGAMAAGIPVVTSVPGDVNALVSNHGVGLTARPEDPEDLAAAIRRAAELTDEERKSMRDQARNFYRARMSVDQGYARLRTLLERAGTSRVRSARHRLQKNGDPR